MYVSNKGFRKKGIFGKAETTAEKIRSYLGCNHWFAEIYQSVT